MMTIEVLGMGCPKCSKLEQLAREAAAELGLPATVEKVTDMRKIMEYGVLSTPALVVNGKVKVSGRIPSRQAVTGWLREETER